MATPSDATPSTTQNSPVPTPYERMGGHEAFATLVRTFYEGVRTDPELRALYPEEDLGPAEERLRMFFEQYWGGPTTYSERRGHPRLRMRHMPFEVTPGQRDRWLTHMMAGVDAMRLPEAEDAELREYVTRAAWSMVNAAEPEPTAWWKDAVVYQVYPRSFADGNGDGMGDLPGITSALPHLRDLGVDAVWLSPFYPSPQADAGYDVADYRDVNPTFGTLKDADELIATAHELGLRVLIDIVPNHTSDEHEWFRAALASEPGSPERARYIFRRGKGENNELPPNNWTSQFHGPAWTQVEDGSWYLHMFDSKQPDLDWTNPEVGDEFESILRFWCDRGVDGFRIDVAHGLVKAEGLPDAPENLDNSSVDVGPQWDQEGVHEIYRRWRRVLEEYNPSGDPDRDRILVAEAWVATPERAARYVRPDEMHHGFGFTYLTRAWDAEDIAEAVRHTLKANGDVGAVSTWVLSNHDVVRPRSRFGYRDAAMTGGRHPIGPDSPQPDLELGLARARAAATFMLGLPGSAYLYQGEELGLPEVVDITPEQRQDPGFFRSKGEHIGRDGCRVPIPWVGDAPAYGFNDTGESWLPQPEIFGDLARDKQEGVPGSTLELYRELLRLRRLYRLGEGSVEPLLLGEHGSPQVASFVTITPAGRIALVLNTGDEAVPLPAGEVLVTSVPSSDEAAGADAVTTGELAGNAAAWVRLPFGTPGSSVGLASGNADGTAGAR